MRRRIENKVVGCSCCYSRRRCCSFATFAAYLFFLVLSSSLAPTSLAYAETGSFDGQNLRLDQVFRDIATEERQFWLLKMSSSFKFGQNSTAKGEPRRHTDPTGVYSPVKAAFNPHNVSKSSRSIRKRDLPFIYQSPPTVPCPNAASTSIISGSKAVDFASFALGILTLVININNNINNNNNNNNNINLNAVDSSNIVANFNTNNANQVNIMPPGGRKRRSLAGTTAVAAVALLQVGTGVRISRHESRQTNGCRG